MAIEFRCEKCNKLLRTGDDTAGKQAKCPECSTVMTIPLPAPASSMPPPSDTFVSSLYSTPPSQLLCEITPSRLDLGEVFSRSWTIFKQNWVNCLISLIIVYAIGFGVNMVCGFLPVIGPVISTVIQIWIGIGMALFFLKTARGQQVEFDELFKGWPYFWKIFLGSIMLGLISFGAVAACALPLFLIGLVISHEVSIVLGYAGGAVGIAVAVYFGLVFSQFYYLLLDRDIGVIDSFKLSMELMEGNKLTLFGISILSGLIAIVAIIPCFMGLLVAIPYFTLMRAAIYLIVTGQPMADQMQREHAE